jgi:hypothetical protein
MLKAIVMDIIVAPLDWLPNRRSRRAESADDQGVMTIKLKQ